MSDKENTGELVEMVGVHVVNTAHDGYRRAGFVLQKGENILSAVSASVFKALEADPRLAVMVIASDIDSDTSGRLGDQVVSTAIMFDEAPLAPILETAEGAEMSHVMGDITVHGEERTEGVTLTHHDETATSAEVPAPTTETTAPVEATTPAPDTETAQPETPKKGKGKK